MLSCQESTTIILITYVFNMSCVIKDSITPNAGYSLTSALFRPCIGRVPSGIVLRQTDWRIRQFLWRSPADCVAHSVLGRSLENVQEVTGLRRCPTGLTPAQGFARFVVAWGGNSSPPAGPQGLRGTFLANACQLGHSACSDSATTEDVYTPTHQRDSRRARMRFLADPNALCGRCRTGGPPHDRTPKGEGVEELAGTLRHWIY